LEEAYVGLPAAVRTLRLERGLTRKALATAADISVPYIAKIESGERRPQPPVLKRLAEALGVRPAGLIEAARLAQAGVGTMAILSAAQALGVVGLAPTLPVLGAIAVAEVARRSAGRKAADRNRLIQQIERELHHLPDDDLQRLVATLETLRAHSAHPSP
jgi:transcriptional regulator with XRE-family HTH domain